jgi:tyrosyl-tRNA synthetase
MTAAFKSEFLKTCAERGLIHQCTDESGLDNLLANKQPVAAYIGFDCTATSLHVGSLIQILMLRRWQQAGHKPIILMGGGTTKVGDPSGKDKSRPPLTDEQIQKNMDGIKTVFEKFLTFGDGATDAVMVNNDDWLQGLKYIEFLRDFGRHFSINRMLTMDSVKLRLEREQPLSFLEFNYMILQGFDFYHLADAMDVRAQFGGSDQWGNIVNGTELNRRIRAEKGEQSKELFGLTTPLFTNAAGQKMGKTADGAVWLNADMFSAYDYWQFWRNAEDAMVSQYLRWFTDLPLSEIEKLEALQGAEINEAKKVLATEATRMLHGDAAAQAAAETAQKTFEQGAAGAALPEITLPASELATGIALAELFRRAGLVESNGEAKRLVQGGGAKVNDEKVADVATLINDSALNAEGFIKLSAGKKKHAIVKVA